MLLSRTEDPQSAPIVRQGSLLAAWEVATATAAQLGASHNPGVHLANHVLEVKSY